MRGPSCHSVGIPAESKSSFPSGIDRCSPLRIMVAGQFLGLSMSSINIEPSFSYSSTLRKHPQQEEPRQNI